MPASPGTVIPSGTAVSPGGDIGIPGPGGVAGPAGDAEVGSIKAWPSVTPPPSWAIIDGSAVSRTLYPQLFALIGTTFGAGDGSTTFNLPDGRSRFILNWGQGSGLTDRLLAAIGGEENHVLGIPEIPSHQHSLSYSTPGYSAGGGPFPFMGGAGNTMLTTGIGGGGGHNTMPPFLCLVYIIKMSPTGGPTAQAPIADSTQSGLMNQLSGRATDYVGGDNACHPLSAVGGAPFVNLNAAYTIQASDNGKYFVCVAQNAFTLTLPAPAPGLTYSIRNDSSAIFTVGGACAPVSVQPTGGAQLDNSTSGFALVAGQECTLFCDGTNWRSRGRVRNFVIGSIDMQSSVASQVVVLPSCRIFEIDVYDLVPSAAGAAINFQLSINGGSSFITTGYYDTIVFNNTASTAAGSYAANGASARGCVCGNRASDAGQMNIKLWPSNGAVVPTWLVSTEGWTTVSSWIQNYRTSGALYNPPGVINALQFLASAGTFSGSIIVRGIL